MTTLEEGDSALLRVRIARVNSRQALIEFISMQGPYTVRVPVEELQKDLTQERKT